MAGKNDKLPGHKWYTQSMIVFPPGHRFLYKCKKCGTSTLNGDPLLGTAAKECKK